MRKKREKIIFINTKNAFTKMTRSKIDFLFKYL
ncbi:MAG: hypothetical protein US83_C0009G0035 [Candidatus Falkowbacteria bacterium GW2011_GWC2_38_22]|nr:MAG: hypothetical protein US73_C0012G0035 [Candidatus Falkowbacteria bacterium GW2011_GWF2_38_1205]KKQ61129.1 MAG: hypothetical protein US83_C0009G0035 [Candidatus Falkowbacteria bacterium GW2011_GWC2_38_22]